VIFSGIGRLVVLAGGVLLVFGAAAFCWPKAEETISAKNKPDRSVFFMFEDVYFFSKTKLIEKTNERVIF
jgi:hypothetical protein